MSVVLSRIDFDPQKLADEEEAELDREDARQQQELKAFLDNELNDEFLNDASFSVHQTQGYDSGQNGYEFETHVDNAAKISPLTQKFDDHINVGEPQYSYGDVFSNIECDTEGNEKCFAEYDDQTTFPFGIPSTNQRINEDRVYKVDKEAFATVSEGKPDNNSQLQILYAARGRKIKELQQEMETKEDDLLKNNRILQHRLNMMSSERDGLQTSQEQLQSLLQDHKEDIVLLQQHLESEQSRNIQLSKQLDEMQEKLQLSDSTIDALQLQITQLSQSDSIARARAQHESMLATLRQKHEAESLLLKEKLDDLQQALAWKTEDVNRYREMLDSNSTATEVGMLRHRLEKEEKTNEKLNSELEQQKRNNDELDEQLKTLAMLVRPNNAQFASTPVYGENLLEERGKLDFKTPVSRFHASRNMVETPPNVDAAMRNELVKALTTNREKEKVIADLKEQIHLLQHHSDEVEHVNSQDDVSNLVNGSVNKNTFCRNCNNLQASLNKKNEEVQDLNEKHNKHIQMLQEENADIKVNMANIIKDLDKEKVVIVEKNHSAMMVLLDDAKEKVREEMTGQYEAEKEDLLHQIEQLTGDLLFTKTEYVRLGEDIKNMEEHLRKEFSYKKQSEIQILTKKLKCEYEENLQKNENNLLEKHAHNVESEKKKWQQECQEDHSKEVEQKVTLAKIDWMQEYETKKNEEMKVAIEHARMGWLKEVNNKATNKYNKEMMDAEFLIKTQANEERLQQLQEEHEREIKNLKQSLETAEADLLNKQGLWETCKSQLESKIGELQSLIHDNKKESKRFVTLDSNADKIRPTSPRLKCSCKHDEKLWKEKELAWKLREEELMHIVEEAREKLKLALESSDLFDDAIQTKAEMSPMTENRLSFLLVTKEKLWRIKEASYNREVEHLKEEKAKLETNSRDLEKLNIDLQRNLECFKAEQLGLQNFYEQHVSDFKEEILKLKDALTDSENHVVSHKLKLQTVEEQKQQIIQENEKKSEQLIFKEKEKWKSQMEKWQEEALKMESERLRNNLLVDLQKQNDNEVIHQIEIIKEQHGLEVRQLKQAFRNKLERISDLKKRILDEEKLKRENMNKKYEENLSTATQHHEKDMKQQRDQWQMNMDEIQQENMKAIKHLKDELVSKEKMFRLQKSELEKKVSFCTQEVEQVKFDHQKEMSDLEKRYAANKVEIRKSLQSTSNSNHDVQLEKMHQFYLKALNQLKSDVMTNVVASRERATKQMQLLIQLEKRRLLLASSELTGSQPKNSLVEPRLLLPHTVESNFEHETLYQPFAKDLRYKTTLKESELHKSSNRSRTDTSSNNNSRGEKLSPNHTTFPHELHKKLKKNIPRL